MRFFWIRNGPNRVRLAGSSASRPPDVVSHRQRTGDGSRLATIARAPTRCGRRRRLAVLGRLLGERSAVEAQAVLVVDDGDVEARLELLAQRLQEAVPSVSASERSTTLASRRIDGVFDSSPRRAIDVRREVGAVALAPRQRLGVGAPEAPARR